MKKELNEVLRSKSVKESVKFISEKYHVPKNTVYKKALELKERI